MYDLGFSKYERLIFRASLSLSIPLLSSVLAYIIHQRNSLCWVLSLCWIPKQLHQPPTTQGWLNPSQTFSNYIPCLCLHPGLKTYLISGRKVEPHSHCSCSQLGSAGPEHADPRSPTARVHTPDGASVPCNMGPDRAMVSVHCLNYVGYVEEVGIFLFFCFVFFCTSPLPEEELAACSAKASLMFIFLQYCVFVYFSMSCVKDVRQIGKTCIHILRTFLYVPCNCMI